MYSLHSSVSELPKEKIVIFADRHRSDIGIKHSKNRPRTQAVADSLTAAEVGNSHATDQSGGGVCLSPTFFCVRSFILAYFVKGVGG